MVKFSVGREDDVEGPSRPRPKKRRTNGGPITSQQQEETTEQTHKFSGIRVCRLQEEDSQEDDDVEELEVSESLLEEEETQESHDVDLGSISVTLTDPEVLDCPVCLDPLTIPVYQCENGHAACSSCCRKLSNKCPSCSWPIGYNRCRALEKVLESLKTPCPNTIHGCPEIVTYNKKLEHEKLCIHFPCFCPIPSCKFVGSSKSLVSHFKSQHSNCAKRFSFDTMFQITVNSQQEYLILQERNEGSIFVLYNAFERAGNMLSVGCIGWENVEKGFTYELIARREGNTVRLQAAMDIAPSRDKHPGKIFLLVPEAFTNLWKIELQIRIMKV